MGGYQSEPPMLIVDVRLSDDVSLNGDLFLAARSAAEAFSALFSVPPPAGPRPITVLYRAEGPLTDSTSDPTQYQVYLSVTDRCYAQLVFQLGHELCHILADPRRTNWFVESCCETASLVLLRRTSKLWASNPPCTYWSSYAPEFQQYAQNRIRQAKETEAPNVEQKKVIIAEMLCPLFEEGQENWNALSFLGQASTPPPASLTDWNPDLADFSFDRWQHAVPECLEDAVAMIARTLRDRWPELDLCHTVMPL